MVGRKRFAAGSGDPWGRGGGDSVVVLGNWYADPEKCSSRGFGGLGGRVHSLSHGPTRQINAASTNFWTLACSFSFNTRWVAINLQLS